MSSFTSDNSYYQDQNFPSKASAPYLQSIAQGSALVGSLPDHVREYLEQSIGANSRRAYASDLKRFRKWGGKLPSDATVLATYFADHAETHSISTLRRWAASLSRAHTALGFVDPTKQEPARSTLRGISRHRGAAKRCAEPLLRDDLFLALDRLGSSVRDVRDRALLLVGFAAGFRRSELAALDFNDVAFVRHGVIITLRRSKTDQDGFGRDIAIPFGKTRHCPVAALEAWLSCASILAGPIFRSVSKGGIPQARCLSAEAVSNIVKQRVAMIGLDPSKFSGHSLRAGFATTAAQAGVPSWKIRQQTGHASDAMLSRYIRSGELFIENAAAAIL
ncbi:site-specific integrase [Pseudorhizobium marinum]|uniref:site-specific integrase n=1 Tax=Pseudorhizobium marinum TaxID=1496690 RepID=UPI0009DEB927|nr:site-specific integrase [Pseudorhizobium marinum]